MRNRYLAAASVCAVLSLLAASVTAQTKQPLELGRAIEGSLSEADASAGAGIRADYRLRLRAGQRIEAVLRSDAFDAWLGIYEDAADEPLASDDDGLGQGTDARLRFAAPRDGVYVMRAQSLGGDETGEYVLSVSERAAPPRAGRPQGVRVGSETQGRLDATAPEDEEGRAYRDFSLRLSRDQRVSLRLNSTDFDPMVRIGRLSRGGFDELAANDDGDDGLNAFLVFTAPERGDYVIRATSFAGDGDGTFTLLIGDGPMRGDVRRIAVGQPVEGRLGDSSPVNDAGQRADAFRFDGREGQRVRMTLTSGDFDAYLELFHELADGSRESLGSDDDGLGEGTDARLIRELPADGSYVVEARAFGGGGEGAYRLSLDELPPPPKPEPLAFGQTVQGEVSEDGSVDDNGRPFAAYRFSAAQGQRIRAIMRSGDFDAYLELGEAVEPFVASASDDDGLGEGTDAQLSYTAPATGDYIIRAMPLGAGSTGLFSLELIDRGPQPAAGSLLIGSTVRAVLDDDDTLTEDGALADMYRIQVKAGDKLRLTMVSNAFDAFVEIGREAEPFRRLAFDDDGLSDTHARLDWTAPEDGVYVVRARSYGPAQTGPYALTIERQP